ncbi:DNA primase [Elusimicrobiota bacterium]
MDLEPLKAKLDILELAREHLRDLKRAGKSWVARCPFHEEKTASFHINAERGVFHCFGCKKGGDAIKFYMEMEKVDFVEAITALCERVGLPKPGPAHMSKNRDAEQSLKADVRKALSLSMKLYEHDLWNGDDALAQNARKYLHQNRKIDQNIARKYNIGLAGSHPTRTLTYLVTKHGINPRVLEKAGIVVQASSGDKYVSFLRTRLVFPVFDLNGHLAGFGGRYLEMGDVKYGPKYLNSPDTIAFKKGEILYGLYHHRDAIREKAKAYLVEGYFDVVGLAQGGLSLAVAPMGGAVTPYQARLLKRFAEEVVVLFDPDQAGITSAIRASRLLIKEGISVRALSLPDGMDPDEFIHAHGPGSLEKLEKEKAVSFLDFELQARLRGQDVLKLEVNKRIKIVREMTASLLAINGEIERRESCVHVARALNLDPIGVERELSSARRDETLGGRGGFKEPDIRATRAKSIDLEEILLALALDDGKNVVKKMKSLSLSPLDFDNKSIGQYIFGNNTGQEDAVDNDFESMKAGIAIKYQSLLENRQVDSNLDHYLEEFKTRKLKKDLKGLRHELTARKQRGEACDPAILDRISELSRSLKTAKKTR